MLSHKEIIASGQFPFKAAAGSGQPLPARKSPEINGFPICMSGLAGTILSGSDPREHGFGLAEGSVAMGRD
jgi:hypothetical protein